MSDTPKQPPIERLLAIMARLRDPERGCEWDLAQDFTTIAPYTIEEAYEVADAIARDDMAELRDELGDLLLQVVFHARMAEEAGLFAFADVAAAISDKMEMRHPHIFAAAGGTMDEARWEDLKASEREAKGVTSALDGVALALPALMRAQKLQKRAARTGFDWPDPAGSEAKITEETEELKAAASDQEKFEEAGQLRSRTWHQRRRCPAQRQCQVRASLPRNGSARRRGLRKAVVGSAGSLVATGQESRKGP
jgi:nucleoside triphosphate diphosphatase